MPLIFKHRTSISGAPVLVPGEPGVVDNGAGTTQFYIGGETGTNVLIGPYVWPGTNYRWIDSLGASRQANSVRIDPISPDYTRTLDSTTFNDGVFEYITTLGYIQYYLLTQPANTAFMGPATGAATTPTWRLLVAADIPDLSATYQPLDADLTALAALTGTDNIYYRSGAATWTSVTIGTGLSFSGGTLSCSVSVTPAALTRTDDTNVTLTLGGTPATALLQATSITAGWTGILASSRGGTGNGFTKFSGPTTSEKTFTLPDASATILTDAAVVTSQQGGTGINNGGRTLTVAANSGTISFTSTVTLTVAATASVAGTNTGDQVAATQAEQEAGSSTTVFTSPGRQQYHPSAGKGWINFNGTGTVAINASYNVSSLTDNGTGAYTIAWDTDFSSANYAIAGAGKYDSTGVNNDAPMIGIYRDSSNPAAGSVKITAAIGATGGGVDCEQICIVAFGDQ